MSYSKKAGQIINHFSDKGEFTGFSIVVDADTVRHMTLNGKNIGFSRKDSDGKYCHYDKYGMAVEVTDNDLFNIVYETLSDESRTRLPAEKKAIVFTGIFSNMNRFYRTYNGCIPDDGYDEEDETVSELRAVKRSGKSAEKNSFSEKHRSVSGNNGNSFDAFGQLFMNMSDMPEPDICETYDYREEFPEGDIGDYEYENWLDDIND